MPTSPQPSVPSQTTPPATPPKPPLSKKNLLFTFLGLFLLLFVLFLVFLVLMLFQNNGNNPILGALGIEPILLQQLLSALISIVFGLLSFIAFIVAIVGLFRRFTSAPAEVEKKKRSLIMASIAAVIFFFLLSIWIVLYFYIAQLQLGTQGAAVIITEPAVTTELTAPLDIVFKATQIEALYVREGIVSYAWDLDGDKKFDDGNGRDIQYTYKERGNADGVYNVAVKVILGTGKEVTIQRLVTIANVLPEPEIEYSPKVLEVPVEISFDAKKSKDPGGTIIAYSWDFNADQVEDDKGPVVKHVFTEAIEQEIILTVTDNNNARNQGKMILKFIQGKKKQAFMVLRPGVIGSAPFSVSFDASSSFIDERIQKYEWDFGDNTPIAQGRLAQHTYAEEGKYTVKLMIEGPSGKRYETQELVTVERPKNPPEAIMEVKNQTVKNGVITGNAPMELVLDASKSKDRDGTIIEYRWDFNGDKKSDDVSKQLTKTFEAAGTFIIALTVVDDDNVESTTSITLELSVPDLLVDLKTSTVSGTVPLEVQFDASGSRSEQGKIISYTWNFGDSGDGIIGSAKQTYRYDQVGQYKAKVSVLTDNGKQAESEILIVVREIELQAEFTVFPEKTKVGEKFFFDASFSQGSISRYYWDFGDSEISRLEKPEHIYQKSGTYSVQLEIYDRKNRVSRKSIDLLVE